jgi:aryl-alcohol dehydrogenase (NADP+)
VDLYQLHMPDPETPIDESLRALEDVVRSGRARYVGCSNFLAYQVARALGRSEVLGVARFDSVQPRYNLLFREIERELLPLCREEGLGVIPFNPIAGGFLSGKHRPAAGPPAGRFTLGNAATIYQDRYWHDRMFATVEQLRPLAAEAGLDLVTMAVAWVMANPVDRSSSRRRWPRRGPRSAPTSRRASTRSRPSIAGVTRCGERLGADSTTARSLALSSWAR